MDGWIIGRLMALLGDSITNYNYYTVFANGRKTTPALLTTKRSAKTHAGDIAHGQHDNGHGTTKQSEPVAQVLSAPSCLITI